MGRRSHIWCGKDDRENRQLSNPIYSRGEKDSFLNDIVKRLARLKDYTVNAHSTRTLKGLDIRNILIDKGGLLRILDPGKMKRDCIEADLARFLVTCRILYWGSMLFFSSDNTGSHL